MNDLPNKNFNQENFFRKIVSFWNGLDKTLKRISVSLGIIVVIVGGIITLVPNLGTIKNWINPQISEDILNQIPDMDILEANERQRIFDECMEFGDQCFKDLVKEGERAIAHSDIQKEIISWICTSNENSRGNAIFGDCISKGNHFIEVESLSLGNDQITRGITFYINLFAAFKDHYELKNQDLYRSLKNKIENDDKLTDISRVGLKNELNQLD